MRLTRPRGRAVRKERRPDWGKLLRILLQEHLPGREPLDPGGCGSPCLASSALSRSPEAFTWNGAIDYCMLYPRRHLDREAMRSLADYLGDNVDLNWHLARI